MPKLFRIVGIVELIVGGIITALGMAMLGYWWHIRWWRDFVVTAA